MHKIAYQYDTSTSIIAKLLSTPKKYTGTFHHFLTLIIAESNHSESLAGRHVPKNKRASINSYADIKSHSEELDLGFPDIWA